MSKLLISLLLLLSIVACGKCDKPKSDDGSYNLFGYYQVKNEAGQEFEIVNLHTKELGQEQIVHISNQGTSCNVKYTLYKRSVNHYYLEIYDSSIQFGEIEGLCETISGKYYIELISNNKALITQ